MGNRASQNAEPFRFPSRPEGGGLGTGRGNLDGPQGFSCRRLLFEERWGMLACGEGMCGADLLRAVLGISNAPFCDSFSPLTLLKIESEAHSMGLSAVIYIRLV